MIKKIVSVFALLMIMLGAVSVSSSSGPVVYLNETFNSYATNASPDGVRGAVMSRVVPYNDGSGKLNKALMLKSSVDGVAVRFPLAPAATDDVFIEISFKWEGADVGDISLTDSTGVNIYKLLKLNKEGALCTYEGKKLGVSPLNRIVNIGVYINRVTRRLDFYEGGKMILSKWYSPSINLVNIGAIILNVLPAENTEPVFYINSIRAYDSSKPLVLQSEVYNFEEIEYVPPAQETEESLLYFSYDFDYEDGKTSTFTKKNNIMEQLYDKETQNGYLHIVRTSADPYFTTGVANVANNVIIEFDINYKKLEGSVQPFAMFFNTGATGQQSDIYITAGGFLQTQDGEHITTLKKGTWYRISARYNFMRHQFDVYVDDVLLLEKYPMKNQNASDMSACRFYISNTGGVSDFCIDNFKMYSGKLPKSLSENISSGFYEEDITDDDLDEETIETEAAN